LAEAGFFVADLVFLVCWLIYSVFVAVREMTWPGDLELAPDAMDDEIKAAGEWFMI
jgi:hypothetical protein